MKKFLNVLKIFLGWPVSIISLFFIFKIIADKSGFILPNIQSVNYLLLFYGFVFYFLYYFLRCILWQKILKEKGHEFSLKETSYLWVKSEFKRYVPGNIWPLLSRAFIFNQKGVDKKDVASAMLIEMEAFVVGGAFISLLCISFVASILIASFNQHTLILTILPAIVLSIIFLFGHRLIKRTESKLLLFTKYLFPHFSTRNNLLILSIPIVYLTFYGFGTYFVISSLFFLSPLYLSTFVGFFVFSLMAGYLSIVTPMGLGVREGVTTFGLSRFIALSQAGVAPIFARIFLIFSEMVFICFTFLWYKVKNKYILRFESFVRQYKYETILILFIITYILYFTPISFLRFDNFYAGRFDLGNMDQTVWNTYRGRFFQLTNPDGTDIISRLAFHADYILVLIAPLYNFWSDPRLLLLIQTIILGVGAYFVYLISNFLLKHKIISLIFALAFLLNPSVQYTNLFDFHAVTLATTFLLGAFYYLLRKKYYLFLLFAIFSALTKEQVWATISFFGAFIIYSEVLSRVKLKPIDFRKVLFGIAVFAVSISIFYYLIAFAIPSARGGNHFALSYYSDFGTTPGKIFRNIFFSPLKTLSTISHPDRIDYLQKIFAPLGFFSVFSPTYLFFAIPDFLINLLSNNSQLYKIYYQYTAVITPFIFISAIYTVKKIRNRMKFIPMYAICIYILFFTIKTAYFDGPLPGAKNPNLDMIIKQVDSKDVIDSYIMRIPKRYSISATNNIGSHLSHRQRIYNVPVGIDKADYILFLLNDPFAQPSLKAQIELANKLRTDFRYREIFEYGDFVVFKRVN